MIQISTAVLVSCDYCHRPYLPPTVPAVVHTFTPLHPDRPPVLLSDAQVRHQAGHVLDQLLGSLRDPLAVIATGAVHANCRTMYGTACPAELEHMAHATAAGT